MKSKSALAITGFSKILETGWRTLFSRIAAFKCYSEDEAFTVAVDHLAKMDQCFFEVKSEQWAVETSQSIILENFARKHVNYYDNQQSWVVGSTAVYSEIYKNTFS